MFGYLQSINPSSDVYISECGNVSVAMSQRGYNPSKRDMLIMRSIATHYGSDKMLLWFGDYHDITVSHAKIVFGDDKRFAFLGTNATASGRLAMPYPRVSSEISWREVTSGYLAKEEKEKIVVYIHEPLNFVDQSTKKPVPMDEVLKWLATNVVGPIVIRMDCKKHYDGLVPKGNMYYLPFEKKLSLRYLLVNDCGRSLDWTVGASFDVRPYLTGFNLITRSSPVFSGSYDQAVYAMMTQATVPRSTVDERELRNVITELCYEHQFPTPEIHSTTARRSGQAGEVWTTSIRAGPLFTGQHIADTKEKSLDLAYREMLGILEQLTVQPRDLGRGCC
nr:VP9 [Tarumizu tick virus]